MTDTPASDPVDVSGKLVWTKELTKSYGGFEALRRCSMEVREGEIFGLLGPNGAGKTTLIRLLLGYLHLTSGSCRIVGFNPEVDSVAVRTRVAYLPGDARLPRHMRGRGVLEFFAQMHPSGNLQRSLEVAERLELDLSRHVAFMSTGMRQKLALAVVFGPQTPLLILDEPTANLDPTVRGEVLKLVLAEREEGRTVMFSSHVLSEIEQTCDRVAFLRKGELVKKLVMDDLFQRHRLTAVWEGEDILSGAPTNVACDRRPEVPLELQDQIERYEIGPKGPHGIPVRIDTAGDLSPTLTWLASLPLGHVRIEPLGLHTVYESVHLGRESMTPSITAGPIDSVEPGLLAGDAMAAGANDHRGGRS